MIYGFIVTIPSDKYIMGVKTVTGNEDEEVEEAENIIDRELLNFWYLWSLLIWSLSRWNLYLSICIIARFILSLFINEKRDLPSRSIPVKTSSKVLKKWPISAYSTDDDEFWRIKSRSFSQWTHGIWRRRSFLRYV